MFKFYSMRINFQNIDNLKYFILLLLIILCILSNVSSTTADDKKYIQIKSIPHVGELYFDPDEVRTRLNRGACYAEDLTSSVNFIKSNKSPPKLVKGMQPASDFTMVINNLNSRLLLGGYDTLIEKEKDLILKWARSDAMRQFEYEDSSRWWAGYIMLPITMIAVQLLDHDNKLSAKERKDIDRWFTKLIDHFRIGEEIPAGTAGYQDHEQRVNNHNTRRNLIAMIWAIRTNDPTLFNRAVDNGYIRFLENIKEDGSLYDANRGNWAMRYTNIHIGAAMFMGEAAAHQGVDLFSLSVKGKTIHTAVKFMLDAADDESLINRYAVQDIGQIGNGKTPFAGKQDAYWKKRPGFETPIGWIEAYIKRFPNHPNTKRLRKLLTDWPSNGYGALSDYSFGNVSCVYGVVSAN